VGFGAAGEDIHIDAQFAAGGAMEGSLEGDRLIGQPAQQLVEEKTGGGKLPGGFGRRGGRIILGERQSGAGETETESDTLADESIHESPWAKGTG